MDPAKRKVNLAESNKILQVNLVQRKANLPDPAKRKVNLAESNKILVLVVLVVLTKRK